ncbi:phage protein [Streptococcus pyogenes]|uniref:Phage protein n=1 Tax=Streptococcus pyogenes TaxID=1314 RepID=A0A8B6J107_STRPY|nr:hypothetical protein [Streptococcus pyogenes]VHC70178.1 phage protein [Streptococcus pyogenes]VHD06375.1 phage protein [Streptococcus pyogenes]VHD32415.1 phage protein [Streptococcus pyogenes]
MKKKLMLAVMLLTVGVATNVKAEEEDNAVSTSVENIHSKVFEVDGEDSQKVIVAPFKVGDESIKLNIPNVPYGYVYASTTSTSNEKKEDKVEKPSAITVERECSALEKSKYSYGQECPKTTYQISGYRANGGGDYTVKLKSPLDTGDRVAIRIFDDGHNYITTKVYHIPVKEILSSREENKSESESSETTKDPSGIKNILSESTAKPSNAVDLASDTQNQSTVNEESSPLPTDEPQAWTQRVKSLIDKAWEGFKYYVNPINWFTSWWS